MVLHFPVMSDSELVCVPSIRMVETLYNGALRHILSQHRVQGHGNSSLKPASVGVFTPWRLAML